MTIPEITALRLGAIPNHIHEMINDTTGITYKKFVAFDEPTTEVTYASEKYDITVGKIPRYITLNVAARRANIILCNRPGKKTSINKVPDQIVYVVYVNEPYFFT